MLRSYPFIRSNGKFKSWVPKPNIMVKIHFYFEHGQLELYKYWFVAKLLRIVYRIEIVLLYT